ncbi:MAG: DEAD/DEAH box helicase [Acidimicrobiia bacterium]
MPRPSFEAQPSNRRIQPGGEAKRLLNTVEAIPRAIGAIQHELRSRQDEAHRALEQLQSELYYEKLDGIATESLRDLLDSSVRLGLVAKKYPTVAGLTKVSASHLMSIDGVGSASANKIMAAVGVLEQKLRVNTPIKLSIDNRGGGYSALVLALLRLTWSRATADPVLQRYEPLLPQLDSLARIARPMSSRMLMYFRSHKNRQDASDAIHKINEVLAHSDVALDELAHLRRSLTTFLPSVHEAWQAFQDDAVGFNQLVIELGGATSTLSLDQVFLSGDLARKINDHPLDTTLLKATLRGYQAFGARFALTQRRTILGDEMGLGKTLEALAVACHLSVLGKTHVLVVAPTSVLVNWLHETTKHTHLRSFRLHGPNRNAQTKAWMEDGGLAITTYGTLGALLIPKHFKLSLLVVDEAHYVKNLRAKRTKSVVSLGDQAERVLYMTGTPLENKVSEFKSLISQLQPSLVSQFELSDFLVRPERFRHKVAPVYLRRNQADVLSELPERIDVAEWLEFGEGDAAAYRRAVESSNFMAMRQAAYAPGTPEQSAKLARVVELVDQVSEQGRKVIVFSYFRGVLTSVANALGDSALEPITGDVTPQQRQALVDEFTNREGPVVLVAQVIAGGVGLNIQAASVVIMAEPQIKPSMEEQAIARSHRMGQTRTVYVHKLLVENSVDERMLEILAEKQRLFDEYAAGSTLKDAADAAIDTANVDDEALAITPQLQNEIIRRERERLGLPEVEVLEPT